MNNSPLVNVLQAKSNLKDEKAHILLSERTNFLSVNFAFQISTVDVLFNKIEILVIPEILFESDDV